MDDMADLVEKARIIAEATGRTEQDVLADLLDDGVLNESNKAKGGLVEELQNAAELITAVQAINRDVSQNSVLNGGTNATKVAVETTLEGDIVDRAIASAQRKAENLRKLALIIAPVFLLVTGGSLEAFGVTDWVGPEPPEEPRPPAEVWGCTAWDAANYDPVATHDDGSCWWEEEPPEDENCDPYFYAVDAWRWTDEWNNTFIEAWFDVDVGCGWTEEVEVKVQAVSCGDGMHAWDDSLIYTTTAADEDGQALLWNMTESGSHWSCLDVDFTLRMEGNDFDVRWRDEI